MQLLSNGAFNLAWNNLSMIQHQRSDGSIPMAEVMAAYLWQKWWQHTYGRSDGSIREVMAADTLWRYRHTHINHLYVFVHFLLLNYTCLVVTHFPFWNINSCDAVRLHMPHVLSPPLFAENTSGKCNGAQRLMSHPCSMASSCVHAVTSYLMCAAL